MPDDRRDDWFQAGEVKPRKHESNSRCPDCKTGPMFHPAHRWGPCQVNVGSGLLCGCMRIQSAPH